MAEPSIFGALTDPQFYGDIKQRLVDALRGGVQDVFPTGTAPGSSLAQQGVPVDPAYHEKMLNLGLAGLTVYHGSPHTFGKFDSSKIGTGEGAQAYGHGIYAAENPSVALEYKNNLSSKYPVSHSGVIEENGKYLAWAKPIDDSAVQVIHTGETKREAQRALKQYMEDKQGALYKADIPDEAVARMLDWDKPLSQQHSDVQAALEPLAQSAVQRGMATGYSTGADAYMAARSEFPDMSAEALSVHLKEAGIPGIRYADAMSRGTGAGTSNYVLFNDTLARILERNGQPTGQVPWAPGEWQQPNLMPSQRAAAQLKQSLAAP